MTLPKFWFGPPPELGRAPPRLRIEVGASPELFVVRSPADVGDTLRALLSPTHPGPGSELPEMRVVRER